MSTPGLSFDGKGINGPDEYRTRIATFTSAEAARKYGPMFEAAPEMFRALKAIECFAEDWRTENPSNAIKKLHGIFSISRGVITKAQSLTA